MKHESALLIIDVQNDFCPGGSLAVPAGDTIVPVINTISPLFPSVVASQDWHPEKHISFSSQHPEKSPFDTAEIHGEQWTLWPDHCVQGTKGAEFHAGLNTRHIRLIVRKGMQRHLDSYSAFFENDTKTSTGLSSYLRGIGITDVYLSGLATDVCVYFSAMDAVRMGFKTYLIEDACAAIDQPRGSLAETMGRMRGKGVAIVKSTSLR